MGKIFGEVKATIEEEIRSERVRREQEEIIRRAEEEQQAEQELDESDISIPHFTSPEPSPSDTIILPADEMPIEEPDDELRKIIEENIALEQASEPDPAATVVLPDIETKTEEKNICSDEEMYKLFNEDDED